MKAVHNKSVLLNESSTMYSDNSLPATVQDLSAV